MTRPKIGYVHSTELLNQYEGMKEAAVVYQQKKQGWDAGLDSLSEKYEASVRHFFIDSVNMTKEQKTKEKARLYEQRESVLAYKKAMDQKARDEDEKMTQGVLNQVNEYLHTYGKENGYTVILGTNQTNTLLYGNEAIDITDEVLEGLNKEYRGK